MGVRACIGAGGIVCGCRRARAAAAAPGALQGAERASGVLAAAGGLILPLSVPSRRANAVMAASMALGSRCAPAAPAPQLRQPQRRPRGRAPASRNSQHMVVAAVGNGARACCRPARAARRSVALCCHAATSAALWASRRADGLRRQSGRVVGRAKRHCQAQPSRAVASQSCGGHRRAGCTDGGACGASQQATLPLNP